MRKLLLAIVCMALWTTVASAQDIYIAQNTTGADNGSDCTDAHSAAWFNSSANWGTGATQIGQGAVVHLCGTFTGATNTTMLTTHGNGITIQFEPDAVLQSPAWGQNGAIYVPNNSVTIDGGTNGTIENTLNGTPGGACLGGPCSVHQAFTVGVLANGTNDVVENLTITHMCVHKFQVNDNFFFQPCGAISIGGANGLVTQNTIDNTATGIGGGASGVEISYNTITLTNHAITLGIIAGTWTGIKIHNNDISQLYNWDEPDNAYHHNGIMLFSTGGIISGIQIYYNYLHGMWSNDNIYGDTHVTAWIFLDTNGVPNSLPNTMIYRNVFEADPGPYNYPANGYMGSGGCLVSSSCTPNASLVANNTVVGKGRCWGISDASNAPSSLNNLCATTSGAVLSSPSTMPYPSSQIDYNIYPGVGTVNDFGLPCANGSCNINTFAAWSASPHLLDVHGSNPTLAAAALTSSYHLGSGSVAIGKAKNLTSMYCTAIPALCVGAPSTFGAGGANAGAMASASGAWDVGAFPSGSTAEQQPNAPTGLTAVVN